MEPPSLEKMHHLGTASNVSFCLPVNILLVYFTSNETLECLGTIRAAVIVGHIWYHVRHGWRRIAKIRFPMWKVRAIFEVGGRNWWIVPARLISVSNGMCSPYKSFFSRSSWSISVNMKNSKFNKQFRPFSIFEPWLFNKEFILEQSAVPVIPDTTILSYFLLSWVPHLKMDNIIVG